MVKGNPTAAQPSPAGLGCPRNAWRYSLYLLSAARTARAGALAAEWDCFPSLGTELEAFCLPGFLALPEVPTTSTISMRHQWYPVVRGNAGFAHADLPSNCPRPKDGF